MSAVLLSYYWPGPCMHERHAWAVSIRRAWAVCMRIMHGQYVSHKEVSRCLICSSFCASPQAYQHGQRVCVEPSPFGHHPARMDLHYVQPRLRGPVRILEHAGNMSGALQGANKC